jgi:hypothetical protein
MSTISVNYSEPSCNVAPDKPFLNGPSTGTIDTNYTYYSCANDTNNDQMQYNFNFGDENESGWLYIYESDEHVNTTYSWPEHGGYYVKVKAKDVFNNESNWSDPILFKTETIPPEITNVAANPGIAGFGQYVNITCVVTDNLSGIKHVTVNITYPDGSSGNYTSQGSKTTGEQVNFTYILDNTWQVGQYNYTIWAIDEAYNTNSSSGHSFNVSANATIGIATLEDTYGASEYINITDPPTPPEDYYLTERGLDYNKYYNANTGNDVLEAYLGPVNYLEGEEWTPIDNNLEELDEEHPAYSYGYRAGNEKGLYSTYFKPNIQDEWPVVYAYDKSDNPTTDVIRTKLVGVGYLDPTSDWNYEYLQGVLDSQGYIEDYSAIYEDVFTGTDVKWSYGNTGMKEEII